MGLILVTVKESSVNVEVVAMKGLVLKVPKSHFGQNETKQCSVFVWYISMCCVNIIAKKKLSPLLSTTSFLNNYLF